MCHSLLVTMEGLPLSEQQQRRSGLEEQGTDKKWEREMGGKEREETEVGM